MAGRRDDRPTVPDDGADETDVGWGDEPDLDRDEDLPQLAEDRPPHWELDVQLSRRR